MHQFPRDSHHKGRDAYLTQLFATRGVIIDRAVILNCSIELPRLQLNYPNWRTAPELAKQRAFCMTWWYIDDVNQLKPVPQVVIITVDGHVETVMLCRQWIRHGNSKGVIGDIDVSLEPNIYTPLYQPTNLHLGRAIPDQTWGALYYNC